MHQSSQHAAKRVLTAQPPAALSPFLLLALLRRLPILLHQLRVRLRLVGIARHPTRFSEVVHARLERLQFEGQLSVSRCCCRRRTSCFSTSLDSKASIPVLRTVSFRHTVRSAFVAAHSPDLYLLPVCNTYVHTKHIMESPRLARVVFLRSPTCFLRHEQCPRVIGACTGFKMKPTASQR